MLFFAAGIWLGLAFAQEEAEEQSETEQKLDEFEELLNTIEEAEAAQEQAENQDIDEAEADEGAEPDYEEPAAQDTVVETPDEHPVEE